MCVIISFMATVDMDFSNAQTPQSAQMQGLGPLNDIQAMDQLIYGQQQSGGLVVEDSSGGHHFIRSADLFEDSSEERLAEEQERIAMQVQVMLNSTTLSPQNDEPLETTIMDKLI